MDGDTQRAAALLAVKSLDTRARSSVRQDAIHVPVEEIARFVDHPALLVQTVVPLPGLDVYALARSMRPMVVDPHLLQIVPMGDGSELLLQGTGRAVADLVVMLRELEALAASDAEPAARAERAPRPVRAQRGIELSPAGEDAMTMLELVMRFADSTGQTALINGESAMLLKQFPIGIGAPMSVTAEQLPSLFEELLFENDFVLTPLLDEPAIFTVHSLHTTARTSAREDARFVDARSLDPCAARPATLFQAVLCLPSADVEALASSARGLIADPNLMQVLPVVDSRALILQGFGRRLVRLRDLFVALDAAAPQHEGGK